MESEKGAHETEMEEHQQQQQRQPCWKKKEPDAGFLTNVKDHLDQFVNTSMDQHRICLKKTIRGVEDYIKLKRQSKLFSSPSSVDTEASSVSKGEGSPAVRAVTSQ